MNNILQEDFKTIAEDIKEEAQRLSGRTVLITGGAGFLGNYIIGVLDYLNRNILKQPCNIISVDNFISGVKYQLAEGPNFRTIKHDIKEPLKIDEPVHFIIHAAGIASPKFYRDYKIQTIDVGAIGTKNMLELAREKKVESMVYTSSSEVYGDPHPDAIPTPETYRGNVACIGPRANYDESKRVGETYSMAYQEAYDIPVKIVRFFNVYGPGMRHDDARLLPNFATHHLNGKPIPVYGNGNQTRTFCYITDGITGLLKVFLSHRNGEVFNVGTDQPEISILGIAEIMKELYHTQTQFHDREKIVDAYSGKSDPHRRCPDISKIKAHLNYTPKVDLRTGIQRFMTWAQDIHSQGKNV